MLAHRRRFLDLKGPTGNPGHKLITCLPALCLDVCRLLQTGHLSTTESRLATADSAIRIDAANCCINSDRRIWQQRCNDNFLFKVALHCPCFAYCRTALSGITAGFWLVFVQHGAIGISLWPWNCCSKPDCDNITMVIISSKALLFNLSLLQPCLALLPVWLVFSEVWH